MAATVWHKVEQLGSAPVEAACRELPGADALWLLEAALLRGDLARADAVVRALAGEGGIGRAAYALFSAWKGHGEERVPSDAGPWRARIRGLRARAVSAAADEGPPAAVAGSDVERFDALEARVDRFVLGGRVVADQAAPFEVGPFALLGRLSAALGGSMEAIREVAEGVATEARASGALGVEHRARAVLSIAEDALGATVSAERDAVAATEILERIALGLAAEERAVFLAVAPRAAIVARVRSRETFSSRRLRPDARLARLLAFAERFAVEHDQAVLLRSIVEAAVDVAGADRGFLLRATHGGELEPLFVSDLGREGDDEFLAFSRSLADAALVDGEPIVATDATSDERFADYQSVHRLALRSVAVVPIRSSLRRHGVLYVEHRMRAGRFDDETISLLTWLAGHAAASLDRAILVGELEARGDALEEANRALRGAKGALEAALTQREDELARAKEELERIERIVPGASGAYGMVGTSEPMRRVYAVIDRVGPSQVPVVIRGESGTGKELVARALHAHGLRGSGPFVAVACGAVPESVLESELFGHVRGAFTGADRERRGLLARAHGGTLFLDEIGDMSAKMQVELLRVLSDGRFTPLGATVEESVDVRVLCATQRPLQELVERGRFRADLYYRLHVVEVRLPPLRERTADLPLLCEHVLRSIAAREKRDAKRLTMAALRRLAEHAWPGNVRQLEHVLLNAAVMAEGDVIDAHDLLLEDGGSATDTDAAARRAEELLAILERASHATELPRTFEDFQAGERQRILAALEATRWNRAEAARTLGMPRRTFYRRLKQYGMLEDEP